MKIILLFIILTLGLNVSASVIDSSLYKTDFERNVFIDIIDSNKVEALDVFMCFDYSETNSLLINSKIKEIIDELKIRDITSKNVKKQIDQIYKYIHNSLLKKYSEKAFFNELFTTGEYNCVTASALYAIILDYFKIKYVIKETPSHVYIVADPENFNILLESTMPNKGVFVFDEKFKKDYVNYLAENKIVSQDELKKNTTDFLFNKHYDQNKTIDIFQLGALQYYNKGIFLIQDLKYKDASINFEKAQIIYPSTTIKYMLNASLANELSENILNKNYDGKILAKYLNTNLKNTEAINYGESYFDVVSNELVINHQKIESYNLFYKNLSSLLSDSLNLDYFNQTYYRILGYNDYVQKDLVSSLIKLNYAYISNPENIKTKEMIEVVSSKYLFTDNKFESTIDSLEYYFDIFPFLTESKLFQRYYTYCYLTTIEKLFRYDEIEKGKIYLERFEEVIEKNKSIDINENNVENTFGTISSYYVRKQKYSTAISYLKYGLDLVPMSLFLKDRLEKLKSSQINISNNYSDNKTINTPPKQEGFDEKFYKNFPKCWNVNSNKNTIKILASKNKEVEFSFNGKKQSGKWAVRTNSKLLYLIPERDKNNYLLFKIVAIDNNHLILRYYENNKFNTDIIEFETCN